MRRCMVLGIGMLMSAALAAAPGPRDPIAQLWRDAAQRKDKELRAKTLEKLEEMLRMDGGQQAMALRVLARLGDVPFERAGFLKRARDLLKSEEAQVRAAALGALAPLGADELDIGLAAELVEDPDAGVRAQVAGAIAMIARANAERGPFEPHPAIEKLLADPDPNVRRQTVRYLWGMPLTEKAEEMLVEMSKQGPIADHAHNEIANDVVYYALSTRPVMSALVARRLIEVMQDAQHTYSNRAAWGLSHHGVADEAREMVVEALIREVDETLDPSTRGYAIYGLGMHGTEAAVKKLRDVAANDESASIRAAAQRALRR